jgi:hypothetical protein
MYIIWWRSKNMGRENVYIRGAVLILMSLCAIKTLLQTRYYLVYHYLIANSTSPVICKVSLLPKTHLLYHSLI